MAEACDVAGCLDVHSSTLPALQDWDLSSASTPTIVILEALLDNHWVPVLNREAHKSDDAGRQFLADRPMSRRSYFQCLIAITDLFSRGLPALHVDEREAYYLALLGMKGDLSLIVGGLAAKEYRAMLKDTEHQELAVEDTPAVVDDDEAVMESLVVPPGIHQVVVLSDVHAEADLEGDIADTADADFQQALWRSRPVLPEEEVLESLVEVDEDEPGIEISPAAAATPKSCCCGALLASPESQGPAADAAVGGLPHPCCCGAGG